MRWLLPRNKLGYNRRSEAHIERPWDKYYKFDESTGQVYTERTTPIQSSDDSGWTRQNHAIARPTLNADTDIGDSDIGGAHSSDVDKSHVRNSDAGDSDANDAKGWERGRGGSNLGQYRRHPDNMKDSTVRNLKGTRSLQDVAIRCILENISDISPETLECLPIRIVERVWYAVDRRGSISFNTWSIFSKILRRDTPNPGLLSYRQTIQNPKSPLYIYANPLSSKTFDFITSLSITVTFPVPDLVKLSNITNLGILEIINPSRSKPELSQVGDRLIRAWHQTASKDGVFPVLRILRLWNHEYVTGQSLNYLNSFPALTVYDVSGCGFGYDTIPQAQKLGWDLVVNENLLEGFEAACIFESPGRLNHQSHSSSNKRRKEQSGEAMKNLQTLTSRVQLSAVGKANTREHILRKIFSRVGELRKDADLVKAGVDIGDQTTVDNTLVNLVPMASLRLGQPYYSTPTSEALSFIRIKLPSEANAAIQGGHSEAALNKAPESTHMCNSTPKQQRQGVTRNKKRKLDDLINSFL